MTETSIRGPLHTERLGPTGAPPMVFVHPNPMDSAAWMFQMAHLSTWFRCLAVDLPGYGRSPSADDQLTMTDIARACWDAVDDEVTGPAVLVGCSVGSVVVQHMYHQRPDDTAAVVVTGAGWAPEKPYLQRHVDAYQRDGVDYRRPYTFADFAESFRDEPLAAWYADLFEERNHLADVDTIVAMMRANMVPDPEWLSPGLQCPALIITGSEDAAHQRAFALHDRFPDSEMVVLEGAGHACNIERPWDFDRHLIEFLRRRGLL